MVVLQSLPQRCVRLLEFEDVGGQVVDDADEPENSEVEEAGGTRMMVMDKVQDVKWIQRLLAREKEIAKARQPGQTPDNCKAMLKVANVYGSLLGGVLESFPVEARECLRFHSAAPLALEMQARRAEAIRRQCDGGGDEDAEELDAQEVRSSLVSTPSVELFDAGDVLAGPRQVAWKLCQAAELNVDQKRAVALVAQPMQAAWEKARGDAEHTLQSDARARAEEPRKLMSLVGTLVRLLLVGGGGSLRTSA